MKTKVRRNVWGNLYGYTGTRKTNDFGLDAYRAATWALETCAKVYDSEVVRQLNKLIFNLGEEQGGVK